MSWFLLSGIALALGLVLAATAHRRQDLRAAARTVGESGRARREGTAAPRLQYPHIDLARCLGCGSCVQACPEEGVLSLAHGQAWVVHGARCVGHGRCAEACPTGAIAVRLADLTRRRDIPVLTEALEAPGVPGLFLAGEVTGFALIRTAIQHGRSVAAEVARRRGCGGASEDGVLDLCIVGAGPAGLACALEARARGLEFVLVDQEDLGGTVAKYPRRKLVMTQPVELPLHGRLKRRSYSKEELLELWQEVAARHDLPLRSGVRLAGVERETGGGFRVRTSGGDMRAVQVCLALGRRGTPRKLGVPGEDLPKVTYSLVDAGAYRGRRLLVVGGGDSAVEAALGLAAEPENRVALSYRRASFSRLRPRNRDGLERAAAEGRVELLLESRVLRIEPDRVQLELGDPEQARQRDLPNDEVFVLIGGEPPFPLLEACGVSFDPAERADPAPDEGAQRDLLRALATALVLALVTLAVALGLRGYYGLDPLERPASDLDAWLRPSGRIGLPLGVAALTLVVSNLAYLLRRSPRVPLNLGSLRAWMSVHMVTGLLALLCALLHSAMAPGDTVGGHALAALAVLVATGALGRYVYAFVPRAANGRELELVEVREQLARRLGEWDRGGASWARRVEAEVQRLTGEAAWRGSFPRRALRLILARLRLGRRLADLEAEARAEGLSKDQRRELVRLARRAQRTALLVAHYEEVRGLMASWRFLHRWVALLFVLLVLVHVFVALRYGELWR